MVTFPRLRPLVRRLAVPAVAVLVLLSTGVAVADIDQLFPGTAILVTPVSGSSSASGGGGSTMTNTFSPPAYVDYKRIGGEPTVVVDRYPFRDPAGTTTYRDLTYVSSPLGIGYPGYSMFWKSDDLGQTFRLPPHSPLFGKPATTAPPTGGGADSHQAVGQVTHQVFFVDLSAYCVTVNTSKDLGETFTPDELGCGVNPGAIDDRQWIDVDELAATPNAYLSFINFTNTAAPTLSLARSIHDGQPGTFATDSVCNTLTMALPPVAPLGLDPDSVPTACPDPADTRLTVAGPVVADKSTNPTTGHRNLYIPFVRSSGRISGAVEGAPPYDLMVARSTDNGTTWTRKRVASLGVHNPANIFPDLTVDNAGNVYVTWAQTQGDPTGPDLGGETDVYYAFSPPGGLAWSAPIDLTQETGDSAVFPWMVAGDAGRVDLVFYRSNTGLNPNVAAIDANGRPCSEDALTGLLGGSTCTDNPSLWNVYFAQSLNALNPGSNFKTSQISDHPIHRGQVCTAGLNCTSGGDRSLLDFFTVDIDHLGAANVVWSDDNNSRNDTRNKFSRQLSGSSVFANQSINLQNAWPIQDHSATDRPADVFSALGTPVASCPAMDVLAAATNRTGDLLTLSLTLNAPPTAAAAVACSGGAATGGLWGAEFWAASEPDATTGGGPNDNFYLAYRDNPVDGGPGAEAGRMNALGPTVTHNEFHRVEPATLGGTCLAVPPPVGACTVTITASLAGLGIKPGSALNSVTGLSVYYFGSDQQVPQTRVALGFSEQADVVVAFEDTGTATTLP